MSTPNDGGPAFPAPPVSLKNRDGSEWTVFGGQGMTLRDYFAAQVLAGWCANSSAKFTPWNEVSAAAFAAADAMLKARENKK